MNAAEVLSFEKHRDLTIAHDLHRILFEASKPKVDFTLLDLAQKTMDGFKDDVGSASNFGSKANSAGLMMRDMKPEKCAMLWALVRSTSQTDRHFALLHNFLTSEIRLKFEKDGLKQSKLAQKKLQRVLLGQH